MNELLKHTEEKMQKTLAVLDRDYKSIRAGRANVSVLDRITVRPHPFSKWRRFLFPNPEF